MTDDLLRLQEIFRENNVHNIRGFNALPTKSRARLDASVYSWFSAFKQTHMKILANSAGLNLCLGLKTKIDDELLGAPLDVVVKKLSFFSQTGVVLTPKFRHPGCRGDLIPKSWYHLVINYMPLIAEGLLAVLPKGMSYLVEGSRVLKRGENFVIVDKGLRPVERNWFFFEEAIPTLKVVDLSEKTLRSQMLEIRPDYGPLAGPAAYIYLPQLSNVPVELLVSMRKHHGDLFLEYNQAIATFLSSSSKAKTARQLADAMRETDAQVRKLQSELEKISSAQAIQRAGVVLKITVAILCCFGSSAAAKLLATMAGGNLLTDGVKYLELRAGKKHLIKETPFYFPWLLHSESQKLAPRPSNPNPQPL